ncbi:MAG TPA: RNA polymerase subunit sigma-24, partial [Pseudomonas sp.]|nr:RNA polymerase subunit sigma-24 [Pseudomonas sp.]
MNAETAFHTHRPRLMALAYRLLGSRADAEDVVP